MERCMATTHLRFQAGVTPGHVEEWYGLAAVGDAAIIAVPSHAYTVRLIRRRNNYVHWWLAGDRGVTVPLKDAIARLRMLHDPPASEAA
jgi:hypothetical protein